MDRRNFLKASALTAAGVAAGITPRLARAATIPNHFVFVNLGGGRCAVSAGRIPAMAVASACSFGVGSIHERSNSQ